MVPRSPRAGRAHGVGEFSAADAQGAAARCLSSTDGRAAVTSGAANTDPDTPAVGPGGECLTVVRSPNPNTPINGIVMTMPQVSRRSANSVQLLFGSAIKSRALGIGGLARAALRARPVWYRLLPAEATVVPACAASHTRSTARLGRLAAGKPAIELRGERLAIGLGQRRWAAANVAA